MNIATGPWCLEVDAAQFVERKSKILTTVNLFTEFELLQRKDHVVNSIDIVGGGNVMRMTKYRVSSIDNSCHCVTISSLTAS